MDSLFFAWFGTRTQNKIGMESNKERKKNKKKNSLPFVLDCLNNRWDIYASASM